MDIETICLELNEIADKEQQLIITQLPLENLHSLALFMETTIVADNIGLHYQMSFPNLDHSIHYFDLIKWGWNLAASLLLKPLDVPGFPFGKSSKESRNRAAGLLYRLGCIVLLRRTVDMIRSKIVSIQKINGVYTIKSTDIQMYQFLDKIELGKLEKLEDEIRNSKDEFTNWNYVDDIEKLLNTSGNFFAFKTEEFVSDENISNINSQMISLIRPWNTTHGVLLGYDTNPDIDAFFLNQAIALTKKWRDESGLFQTVNLGEVTGDELIIVVAFLVSFHLKHTQYCLLALNSNPEINIKQSITIWKPITDIVNSIANYTGIEINVISKAMDLIAFNATDAGMLQSYTSKFMPLLINIGNGYCICPVSSIMINPFFTIMPYLEYCNPKFSNEISSKREDEFRNDVSPPKS